MAELNDPRGPFLSGTGWVIHATHFCLDGGCSEQRPPTVTAARRYPWRGEQEPEEAFASDRQPAPSINTTRRLFDVSPRHSVASSGWLNIQDGLLAFDTPAPLVISGGESSGVFYSDWLTAAQVCCPHPNDSSCRAMLGNGSVIAAGGVFNVSTNLLHRREGRGRAVHMAMRSDASSIGGIGTSTGGTAVSVVHLFVFVAAPVVLTIGIALLDRVSKA